MEAVRKQKSDMSYGSENPIFPFGHGLRYSYMPGCCGSTLNQKDVVRHSDKWGQSILHSMGALQQLRGR